MAQANSELLEDSLKRDAERSRNRASLQEPSSAGTSPNPDAPRGSIDSPGPSPGYGLMAAEPSPLSPPQPHKEGGLFGSFRGSRGVSHLASASMPSLVGDPALKRIEELTKSLEAERSALAAARADKTALEGELESLSQALFEEANKMVAQERMKAAEVQEELGEARKQKEALLSALRVVEGENGTLRAAAASAGVPVPDASFKPSSRPADGDSLYATEADAKRTPSRAPSELVPKSPAARPPRSPARQIPGRSRTPSLTVSTRPSTPIVSSPLAFTSTLSHSPPHYTDSLPTSSSNTSDTPTELPSPSFSASLPPSLTPALAFEGPTPPATSTPTRPPLGLRRSTLHAPDPNLDDPNLPTSPHEADPGAHPPALFARPSLPSLGSLPSLPTLASLRSALPSSPLGSPSASPFVPPSPGLMLGGSPAVRAPPAEESPWAEMRSMSPSLRPALSRVSSISSAAGERIGLGLGRARDALAAGIASALDEDPPMRSPPIEGASPPSSFSRPDMAPRRMSSFEVAAFGLRR